MGKNFRIGESISYGWSKMREHLGLFIVVLLIMFALSVLQNVISRGMEHTIPPVMILLLPLLIVAIIINLIVSIGAVRFALNIHDKNAAKPGDLFAEYRLFFNYLFGCLLYVLIVIGGLILLIVPGIVWAIKYQFYSYAIVDKKKGPVEALKESGRITKGHKWRLFGFFWTALGVNILGLLALIIGLFATIPTTMMAYALIYRRISGTGAPKMAGKPQRQKKHKR